MGSALWSLLAMSYIFPRPQSPWRQCFPHLWAFPRTYQVFGKGYWGASRGLWMKGKDYRKKLCYWQQWGGTLWDNTRWQHLPPFGLCSTYPLGKLSCEGPGLEFCGGKNGWRGLHTKQGAHPHTRRHKFTFGCLKGHLVPGEGGEEGFDWEDRLGLTSVL